MGGRGSGRQATYYGKATASNSLPLDIRRLQRDGLLRPGMESGWQWSTNGRVRSAIAIRAEDWCIELTYTHTSPGCEAELIRQSVKLEATPCTLGGHRPWFSCPLCTRRVAVIYGAGRLFACRLCKRLAYSSQGEAAGDRAMRRADRIRKVLGWRPGIAHGHGVKPKGMHWPPSAGWRPTTTPWSPWCWLACAGEWA